MDFALRLTFAPDKRASPRRNWLGALSLALPAVRGLRVLRLLRLLRAAPVARVAVGAARGARLTRVVGSVNRTMHVHGRAFARHGFGYVGR